MRCAAGLGFIPIVLNVSAGAEVMLRIAAPMVGGIVSATILALVVIPAAYFLANRRALVSDEAVAQS